MFSIQSSTRALAAAAAAMAVLLPGSAGAQQLPVTMAATDATSARVATRADALRERAARLAGVPKRWGEVLDLRLEAAQAAAPDDPGKIADLYEAGVLSAAFGRNTDAARYLEQAAEVALEFGDLFEAGRIFLVASVAARSSDQQAKAQHLLAHAELLARSPYLPAEECDCLEERIAMVRVAMATRGPLPPLRK